MKRVICLALTLLMVLGLCACGQKETAPTWQEQYDLGIRYLSDGHYEEAILAFTAAIEIDPKQAEAYIGLADVYTAQGDTGMAEEILKQALEALGENEAISAALEALKSVGLQPLEGYPRTERADFGEEYVIFEYDEFGRLTRQTSYAAADDAVTDYWEFTYEVVVSETNQYGWRQVTEESYDPDGTPRSRREYLYTPGGAAVVIRESFFSGTGTTAREFLYTMQSPIHSIAQTGYRADGHEEHALIWERNWNGETIREVWVDSEGTVFPADAF